MKKILFIEPEQEQAEVFTDWLKGKSYGVSYVDNPQEAEAALADGKFDLLLMDIDEPLITEPSLKLIGKLKADPRFVNLPVAVLTYRKDARKITAAIETGADSLILKPFETDAFLKCMEGLFNEIEHRLKGKKTLDLNYVNYLIELAGEMEREGFFALVQVIFNKLIIEKIGSILGPPVLMQMIKRAKEAIGEEHPFMRLVDFSGKGISLDGVDKASKEVPLEMIALAYTNYVYAFLQLMRALTSDILADHWVQKRE